MRPVLGAAAIDGVSTGQLCRVWRESYWLLAEPGPGPAHGEVVDCRRRVLDELERRDPAGVARWLGSAPRAGADPGRYLHAPRGSDPVPGTGAARTTPDTMG